MTNGTSADVIHWAMSLSNSDVIAASSVIIASCSLLLAVWQGFVARNHTRVTVRPILLFVTRYVNDGGAFVDVVNSGLGPAIITRLEYVFGGKIYKSGDMTIGSSGRAEIFGPAADYVKVMKWFNGVPVAANEINRLVDISQIPDAALAEQALNALKGLSINIRYSSLYGDSFSASLQSAKLVLPQKPWPHLTVSV